MDKFNRLYRIYRFYILSILFCIFIPNLVYFKKDIYKILYSLPSFEMLFYPVYSVMVTYFDVMFITDYLYYYIKSIKSRTFFISDSSRLDKSIV